MKFLDRWKGRQGRWTFDMNLFVDRDFGDGNYNIFFELLMCIFRVTTYNNQIEQVNEPLMQGNKSHRLEMDLELPNCIYNYEEESIFELSLPTPPSFPFQNQQCERLIKDFLNAPFPTVQNEEFWQSSENDSKTKPSNEILGKSIKKSTKRKKAPKRRKSKLDDNSPFHNCQKHLNKALKCILIVPPSESQEEIWKKVAHRIWSIFVSMNIKSKRVLHFIFNRNNEYKENDEQLRVCGLLQTFKQFGEHNYNEAKNYLSHLAIDQLDELSINNYINTTKIKDKKAFRDYMTHFRRQLQDGFFKRRFVYQTLQV